MSLLHGTNSVLVAYAIVVGAAVASLLRSASGVRAVLLAPVWAIVGTVAAATVAGSILAAVALVRGLPAPLALTILVSALSLLLAGMLVGRTLRPRREEDGLRRGSAVVDGGDSARLARPGIRFVDVPLTVADETKHFKLLGTTGTGKSTAIRALLAQAIARGDRAVVADPDGGYLARFFDPARGDLILNPFDPRSVKWDPFQEIRAPYDCEQLARSLIGQGAGPDRAWHGYAQLLLSALLSRLHALGPRNTDELLRLLSTAPIEELQVLLEGTPARPFLDPGNERMFGSVRAVATARVTALGYVRVQTAAPFSIRDWVERGRGLLFLPYRADQIAALHTIISTWLRTAIFQTMSQREHDHRVWFVIDELDALGAIDGLKDALARLRKFGGRCVLGFQSIAQVTALYGHSDSQTIVENCGTTLILRCSASEQGGTAAFASRLIGEREVVRNQLTRHLGGGPLGAARFSGSASAQIAVEPAVLPSEIEQLPDLCGFLKVASSPEWLTVQIRP